MANALCSLFAGPMAPCMKIPALSRSAIIDACSIGPLAGETLFDLNQRQTSVKLPENVQVHRRFNSSKPSS
jgi:hypothetical protein